MTVSDQNPNRPKKKKKSKIKASKKATAKPNRGSVEIEEPVGMRENLKDIAGRSQRVLAEYVSRETTKRGAFGQDTSAGLGVLDPLNISKAFQDLVGSFLRDPTQLITAQIDLWQSHMQLWQNSARRLIGSDVDPLVEPSRRDKRFRHEDWRERFVFDFLKQSYLLTASWLHETVSSASGLDEENRRKVEFYTQQYVDAISPSNFLLTNPEVLRETIDKRGENLLRGFRQLLKDLERGHGQLSITQTDMEFFEIGRNVATTPGKVVFQNDIFQLLQFNPTTDEVRTTPLLIFPPWINKYYILDLREDNSFIKWVTDQGYTVFVVSWVNPGSDLGNKSFDDYMIEGIFEALDAVTTATGVKKINTIGYCIGGTLLGATLGYMAAKKIDRIKSATFFTAQVDFEESGDLKIFIDEEQLDHLEKEMAQTGGYLEGASMANTFNMLRSNDLIWSYVVNNYLLGKDPTRFDLLYWNADSTRMPMNLHLTYLRECYLRNNLSQGKFVLDGERINLTKVKVPVFLQSGRDDHIAPYRSVYKAAHLYSGPVTYMLAGSGHIAGVVNPPAANKYMYWTNSEVCDSVEEWQDGAEEHPGSWWPYWEKWLRKRSGPKVPAREPGDGKLKVIEDAPGAYVKVRA